MHYCGGSCEQRAIGLLRANCLGCGPEKAGAQAAYFGKRFSVIECAPVPGGSSINTGTVPSKTLRKSAFYFSGLSQRGLYGIDYPLKENLTVHDFMHHEREVVEMERRRTLKNLELHNIAYMQGQAAFEDAHTILVTTQPTRANFTATSYSG